jgi:hypothetical protein
MGFEGGWKADILVSQDIGLPGSAGKECGHDVMNRLDKWEQIF